MKRYLLPIILFIGVTPTFLPAEEVLKVRPKETIKERPAKQLTQSSESDYPAFKPSSFHVTSAQFHIVSPLVQEFFPEKRFRAWGNYVSFSFYLTQISENVFIHLEPGVGATLIRLSLSQPSVEFSHLFIALPLRARLIYTVNKKFFAEAFLGLVLRPWEYDSRDTPDGGFHRTVDSALTVDGGLGGGLFVNENLFGLLSLGTQWLSLGIGILL